MGCDDQSTIKAHVPYCKPECKEFRLLIWLEVVMAQCIVCRLHHDVTVTREGTIRIKR